MKRNRISFIVLGALWSCANVNASAISQSALPEAIIDDTPMIAAGSALDESAFVRSAAVEAPAPDTVESDKPAAVKISKPDTAKIIIKKPASAQNDDQDDQQDDDDDSLFGGYDKNAITKTPKEIAESGRPNVVTQLDKFQEAEKKAAAERAAARRAKAIARKKAQARKAAARAKAAKEAASKQKASAVEESSAVERATTYTVRGKRYTTLAQSDGFVQTGRASWYGKRFHGRKTASGEPYDMNALTAAHKKLPLGTKVRVTNNDNGKSIVVTINDRGPFHGNRILDLSKAAAQKLGVLKHGTANVTIRAL